jgi:hypothetical protein
METSNSLFNNPAVLNTIKSLKPEEYNKYKNIGKELYEKIDYNNIQILNNLNIETNSAEYIIEGIKSGLHPSYLSQNEKNILVQTYGKEWYKKYNYDITDIN